MLIIDTLNFSPISAFMGGILIGIGVILFFVSNGRLAGVSGIINNTLSKSEVKSSYLRNKVLSLVCGVHDKKWFFQVPKRWFQE